MTLSRHRIRSLAVWGRARYLSVTESPQYSIARCERVKNILFFLELEGQRGVRTLDLRLSKQATLTTVPGPRLRRWDSRRKLDETHVSKNNNGAN